ncbi:MAG TPA: glycosyltransferase family 2 protein [Thermoanaerobaculia bacterium]|jgi:hypothetical protein
MATLTIGIPTFNRRDTLMRSIDALIPHLSERLNVLVVNNGSDDGTAERLAAVCATTPYVSALHNGSNLGCDANYLRVIEHSTGTWCWLLGDDTPVDTTLLPALLARLEGEQADAVHLVALDSVDLPDLTSIHTPHAYLNESYRPYGFQVLSANIFRTDKARKYLKDAYRVAGLKHVYTVIGTRLMAAENGMVVYNVPILQEEKADTGTPRWLVGSAHIGAWKTMQSSFPRSYASAINRREARLRSEPIVASHLLELMGSGSSGISARDVLWAIGAFPGKYKIFAFYLALMFAVRRSPMVLALIVWLGMQTFLSGGTREALQRAAGDQARGTLLGRLYRAIRGNGASKDAEAFDAY